MQNLCRNGQKMMQTEQLRQRTYYNHFHNILKFSPQVKRWMIITYKHGIYKLPLELSNNLRLRFLGNQEISGKSQNFIEWQPSAQFFYQNEDFVNISKKLLKIEIKLFQQCAISHEKQSQSQIFFECLSLETFFFL